jgi:hypothetical protein
VESEGVQEIIIYAPHDAEIEVIDGIEQETVELEEDSCEQCPLICQKERNPPCK